MSEETTGVEIVQKVLNGSGITIEVSEAELRRLRAEMQAVTDAAEKVMQTLAELAGPQPGPVPQHLRTMMNMGAGYFRHSAATIAALFQARRAHDRKRAEK